MENSKGQNRNEQHNKNKDQQRERLSNSESLHEKQNTSGGMRNTSAENLDGERKRQGNSGRTGSGISTKRNVSGSEYDGQVSPE